jgi:hypothetical protein
MAKPKLKVTPEETINTTKNSSKKYLTEADAVDSPLLLAPPPWLHAVVKTEDESIVLLPVAAMLFKDDALIGYVPVADELIPVTQVEGFMKYFSGDPDEFDAVAQGLAEPEDDPDVDPDDPKDPDADDDDDDDDVVDDPDDDDDDVEPEDIDGDEDDEDDSDDALVEDESDDDKPVKKTKKK